jgi:hypothetical protein
MFSVSMTAMNGERSSSIHTYTHGKSLAACYNWGIRIILLTRRASLRHLPIDERASDLLALITLSLRERIQTMLYASQWLLPQYKISKWIQREMII